MLKDDILERIFSHPDIQKLPVGYQDVAAKAYTEILEQMKGEKPYDTISTLFSDDE